MTKNIYQKIGLIGMAVGVLMAILNFFTSGFLHFLMSNSVLVIAISIIFTIYGNKKAKK